MDIKLKKLIEDFASEYDKPKVNKFQVTEAIRNFARVGKQLQVNNGIMEAAKQLAEMADNSQNHVLSETSDWFDGVSVKRNMKELKGLTGQFKKTAVEANAVNQRLSALYEDMGNILNRYYDIDEALDPVGQEDDDVDNDGDVDDSDKYLKKRRDAIDKSMKKEDSPFSDPLPDRDKDGNLTNPLEIQKRKLMKQKKEKTAQIDKASGFKAKQPLIKQKQRIQKKINDLNRRLGR